MIDLIATKDPVRVFKNALQPNINPRGTYILYHHGDYSDAIHNTPIGRAVWQAYERGEVVPVQKLVCVEPRAYNYYAVVVK